MTTWGNVARLALICVIGLCTSGCFLNALLALVTFSGGEEGGVTSVTLQASANVRICEGSVFGGLGFQCVYVINGEEIVTSGQLASELGLLGLIIDPLILQVPLAAHGFSGTFSGSASGSLSIVEVAASLRADVDHTITPEPGTKLVIVDFPSPPPALDQAFGFTLAFQLPGNAAPVSLKALFAARIASGGETFFVPLLPCETSFASIPAISLPASSVFQNVALPLTGAQGCSGRVFQLSAPAVPVPTLHVWVAMLLVTLMACYGAYLLRLRG
jgi:hypothetical protein